MYGYSDYNGPKKTNNRHAATRHSSSQQSPSSSVSYPKDIIPNDSSSSSSDDDDPLRAGLWMDGDSLAPPCGASLNVIHAMLEFASVSSDDVLYDLGCGDGRVCLEAYERYMCRKCVGVEIEEELVERFRSLVEDYYGGMMRRRGEEEEGGSGDDVPIDVIHGDLCEVLDNLLLAAEEEEEEGTTSNDDHDKNKSHGDDDNNGHHLGLLEQPTVICLFLLPEALLTIQDRLIRLMKRRNGTNSNGRPKQKKLRVVCNTWGLEGVLEPTKSMEFEDGYATTAFSLYSCND